ncbi:mediator complex subunit Med5-domain-containing protein [Tirmania nivea]|nr:mediator complex subunit Med5-domain-containing protein [Tirmania nivea]
MPAPSAASATYQKLSYKCLASRVPIDRFESFIRQLFSRSPVSSSSIAAELVSPSVSAISDPLQLQYIQRLVETNFLSLGEVLYAVAKSSTELFSPTAASPYSSDDELHEARRMREDVEAGMLLMLAGTVRFQKPKNPESIWTAIAAAGKWMEILMNNTRSRISKEALAEVIIALGQNEGVMKVWTGLIGAPPSRDLRGPFVAALGQFTQLLLAESPLLSSRLEGLFQYQRSPGQQHYGNADARLVAGGETDSVAGMMALVDTSSRVWARSSGVVFIDSLLVGLPLTDDDAILSYLTSRYRDDTNSMVAEFVIAAFDTLATAMNPTHPASQSQIFLLRSFIINKVPLILTRIFLSQEDLNAALSQVLLRIDPAVLSGASGNPFGGSVDMFSLPQDIRQEFLFALALHGLVEEAAIQGILGELPMMTLPTSGRYNSEDLVSQCQLDPDRVERVLEELEGLDGNAGAVALAVVEIIRGMCERKETLSLRSICGFLTRKPSSIDVILMFVKPVYLLEPLCVLLDTWRYEEDLGEYQPVYEDFGYILLLVLTTIHRYDLPLTTSILGESSDPVDSFIPRLLTKGLTAQRIEDIESADTHAQLGGWIKEMFEAEVISDSLMATCRPQDFYMLVPTFFFQSVMAAHRGVLEIDTLKDGFAYLLEPFLMPSLVSALTWLGNHVWENSSAGSEDNLMTPLQIMQSLVVPLIPLSVEKSIVHQTVLSITARHLERIMREVLTSMDHAAHQAPQISAMAEAVLQAVNRHLGFKRAATASHQELQAWINNSGAHHSHGTAGGLLSTFRATVETSVTWSAANYGTNVKSAASNGPPWYTHRLTQTVAHVFGSGKVVSILLDIIYALHQQHSPGGAPNPPTIPTPGGANPIIVDLAIDFAATLIVSPSIDSISSPTAFNTNSAMSTANGPPTSGPQLSAGMPSSPQSQPPSKPQQTVPTAPLSLVDSLRIAASRAIASLTPAVTNRTSIPTNLSSASSRGTTKSTKSTVRPKSIAPSAPKVKLDPRTEINTRLARKVEALLTPYQSQAILPAGTVRAVVSTAAPTAASAAPTSVVSTSTATAEVSSSSIVGGHADDMVLMGMGFGGIGEGFGGGFGGMEMDMDFGGVEAELDLLGEFDASGMNLG